MSSGLNTYCECYGGRMDRSELARCNGNQYALGPNFKHFLCLTTSRSIVGQKL